MGGGGKGDGFSPPSSPSPPSFQRAGKCCIKKAPNPSPSPHCHVRAPNRGRGEGRKEEILLFFAPPSPKDSPVIVFGGSLFSFCGRGRRSAPRIDATRPDGGREEKGYRFTIAHGIVSGRRR